MSNVRITEVARHFSDYVNRVAYQGENFVLVRGNKPVAELRPIPSGRKLSELPDILKSLPKLTEDEQEDFLEDLNTIRDMGKDEVLADPWAL